jgi:polyhydroxyalkanoate synthesis regulator phasin
MQETMRKMLLLGIGVATLTQEKIEEMVNDWVSKGDLSREEGKSLVKEFMAKSQEQAGKLRESVQTEVSKRVPKPMPPATADDLAELDKRLQKLERQVATLTASMRQATAEAPAQEEGEGA